MSSTEKTPPCPHDGQETDRTTYPDDLTILTREELRAGLRDLTARLAGLLGEAMAEAGDDRALVDEARRLRAVARERRLVDG